MNIFFEIYKNFSIARYYKKIIFLYIFTSFNLVLEIFSISLLIPIVGILLNSNILDEYEIFKSFILFINPLKIFLQLNENQNLLGGLCLLYFLIIFLKNIFLYLILRYMTKVIFDIGLDLKSNFLSKIIDMPFLSLNKYKLSGLITYNNNMETIKESLGIILNSSIDIILILGILGFLLFNSPQAMLMIIIISLILFIFNKLYLNNKLSLFSSQIRVNEKEQVNFLLSTLRGLKSIKLDSVKSYFLEKFRFHLDNSNKANFNFGVLSGSMRLIIEVLAAGLISGLIIFFIINELTVEEIVTTLAIFLAGAIKILPSLNKITVSYQSLQYSKDRLVELNTFYEVNLKSINENKSIKFLKNLKIENLTYKYDDNQNILNNINFEITSGEKIFLKGESASGKSTLMNIASGLINCKSGIIKIDNKIISYPYRIINLGYITQKPFFMPDTIINNICFGIKEKDQNIKKAVECLKDARIFDDINLLPNNINTFLSNDGESLSGGQLQRIALARLLYREPDIIILDEFSNALDEENETFILEKLFTKYNDRTIIIISHKEYSYLKFDKKYKIFNKKLILDSI